MPISSKSVDVDTGLHTLSPEFLDALRKVVPRRRHPKLPYIVAVGLLAVLGTLAADPSARELLGARLLPKQAESRVGPVETVKAPVVAPPVPGADGVIAKAIEGPASPISEPASPSAPPVARPKKKVTRPHPAPRP